MKNRPSEKHWQFPLVNKRRIIRVAIALYFIVSLPLVLVAIRSDYVRFVAIQMVTNWRGKLLGIPSAYVGDSITGGGRNWGSFLGAINLAVDGYTVAQVKLLLKKAEKYSPERLFILAGTNDIVGPRPFDIKEFEADYRGLLDRACQTKAQVYITLIPFTSNEANRDQIASSNEVIRRLASERGVPVIDLNPIIAPDGILLDQYTVDGVHLSGAAYKVWQAELASAVRK